MHCWWAPIQTKKDPKNKTRPVSIVAYLQPDGCLQNLSTLFKKVFPMQSTPPTAVGGSHGNVDMMTKSAKRWILLGAIDTRSQPSQTRWLPERGCSHWVWNACRKAFTPLSFSGPLKMSAKASMWKHALSESEKAAGTQWLCLWFVSQHHWQRRSSRRSAPGPTERLPLPPTARSGGFQPTTGNTSAAQPIRTKGCRQ